MKPITCVLAEDETAIWKLVFNMDRRHIYVGRGRPPYKRLSTDGLMGTEPRDALQLRARDKFMSMTLDAICDN